MAMCSTAQDRMKGSSSKLSINFPSVVKMYSKGKGGVDLMDKKTAAYRLDQRSKCRICLQIFFRFNECGSCKQSYSLSKLKWKP